MDIHQSSPLIALVLIFFTTLSSYSSHAADFCVADLTTRETPSGYPCKHPANVTVDDFVSTAFVTKGNTTNPNKVSFIRAFVQQFPALNGLNLAATRIDMEPEGVVPIHSHPYSAEMIFIVEGTVTAGFVSGLTSNVVYIKKLNKGEMMVIPQGFLHFQVNSGTQNAIIFVNFNSPDPGIQFVTSALFKSNFPSFLVEKTTSISQVEVKKLKGLLGGSG